MKGPAMMRWLLTVLLLAVVLSTASAVAQDECTVSPRIAPQSNEDIVRQIDFSGELANSIAMYDEGEDGRPFNRTYSEKSLAWFENLSHEQKMQLGGWKTEYGYGSTLMQTLMLVEEFRHSNSRVPESGLELLQFKLSQSKLTLAALLDMDRNSQLKLMAGLINPQSGRLYSALDGSVNEPGALKIVLLTEFKDVEEAFRGRPGATRFLDPGTEHAWHITVMDKQPGTVLADTVVIQSSKVPPENGTPASQESAGHHGHSE
jgi:hypothetical protein